jgi:ATP phosphoribosyltransferase
VFKITIALSKGRIFEETLPLLRAAGVVVRDDPESSRELIIATSRPDVRVIIVRASDTPTYVQYGAADLASPARMYWRSTAATACTSPSTSASRPAA